MVRGWTWALIASAWGASAHAAPPARAEPPAPAALAAPAAPAAITEPAAQLAARLAWRWAPVYVQHVDPRDRGADRPTRIDFDGNWDTTDNWDRQAAFGAALPPAAYGAAILTSTHAYLTYTLYYPRDWARLCVPFICHDNDLETVQLVVERGRAGGRLVEVRTKAHHAITDSAGETVARAEGGRPLLRVEPRGHGIAVCRPGEPACEPRDGRIVYAPARAPSSPPARATGQTVGYELLSLRDTLWARRHLRHGRLWTGGETGPLSYASQRLGRLGHAMGASMAGSRFVGGVRPPWALAGASGARGDWFLDPAAAGSAAAGPAASAAAARYVHNPFLDDLSAECRGPRCAPAPPERTRLGYLFRLGAPYIALALGAIAVTGLLRPRAGAPRF